MRRFLQSGALKAFVSVIIAIILGAVIAALSHSNNTPLSSATSTALYPLQRVSAYLSYKFSNFNDNFKSSATLAEENEELQRELDAARKEIIDYNEAKKRAYEKIYQSVDASFDYDIEFAKDTCYRNIPSVDNSLFTIARKLILAERTPV